MHIYDQKKLKTKHVCRNDSGQLAKSGEDGAEIKANENSVEHSSGKICSVLLCVLPRFCAYMWLTIVVKSLVLIVSRLMYNID